MRLSQTRYTEKQLRSLGYPIYDECDTLEWESRDRLDALVKGQFKNVIDVLFSSTDGSLDSNPASLVSENAPECVRIFAQNFLLKEVPAARCAPDDATAFDLLIPRSVSSRAELAPYVDFLTQEVSNALKSSDNGN